MKLKSLNRYGIIFSLILGAIGLTLVIFGFITKKLYELEYIQRLYINMDTSQILSKFGFVLFFIFLFSAFASSHLDTIYRRSAIIFSLILGSTGLALIIFGFIIKKLNEMKYFEPLYINMDISQILSKSGFIIFFIFLFSAFASSHLPKKE